jgi:VWFA-related protein
MRGAIGMVIVCATICATAQTPPTFRGRADVVAVDANVRRAGRPVTDLKAEDFEIIDNGVAQQVADVSFGKLPIDVTVALDISSSVTGDVLTQFRRGIEQLMPDLAADDRLKLMTFNQRVKRVLDLGRTTTTAAAALNEIRATGSTAIFDAIAVALTTRAEPDRRQLILVFSDGRDSSSTTDVAGLVDVIHRTTPTIGFVLSSTTTARPLAPLNIGQASTTSGQMSVSFPSVMRSAPPSPTVVARQTYELLARESGGTILLANTGNLADSFKRLLQDFRASYVLHYRPTGVERSGLHTLDVRIKRPGFEVRARRGYDW